ncbi:unnamed protein product, partial [Brenthis ino]
MVLIQPFQDLFESLDKTTAVNLPTSKENALNIEFYSLQDINSPKAVYKGQGPLLPFAASEVFYAPINEWRRLTAVDDSCKTVYEVTFDINGSNFSYKPGDTIGIIPRNSKREVQLLIDHLDLKRNLDVTYALKLNTGQKGAKIPLHIPIKSNLRYVLNNCVDLRGIVKKLFLLALSKYTQDKNEKMILEYLCSKEGSTAYTSHILNKQICILDLFILFKSCKPPVEVLLEHLPRLLPRAYSIVNRKSDDNRLKICFSVIDIGNSRKGLTTGWLESIILGKNLEEMMNNLSMDEESSLIPIYIRKNVNEFYLPINSECPLILIGPGTGVSPYIGFLEEREYLQKAQPNMGFGEVWLFFGCRNPKLDFIYENELRHFETQGVITNLQTAFSRLENTDICYVQDAMIKKGKELTNLIMQGAYIFVCGDVKVMATQVKEVIVQFIEKYGEKTKEEAENYLINMQKEKRYLIDIWN